MNYLCGNSICEYMYVLECTRVSSLDFIIYQIFIEIDFFFLAESYSLGSGEMVLNLKDWEQWKSLKI